MKCLTASNQQYLLSQTKTILTSTRFINDNFGMLSESNIRMSQHTKSCTYSQNENPGVLKRGYIEYKYYADAIHSLKRPCTEVGVVRIDWAIVVCIHSATIQLLLPRPASQLLLTRRGKTSMDGVGIVFELYTAPL